MSAGFFVREAMRSLRRNAVPSFAAMASVLVTTLVLGVFIPVVQATNGAANEVRSKLLLDIYLTPNDTPQDVARVGSLLNDHSRFPQIKHVVFVSKGAALAQEVKRNPGAFELLGNNPLPDTFRISPDSASNISAIHDALLLANAHGGQTPIDPAIAQVVNRRDQTHKIVSATNVIKLTLLLLAALLVIASVLLVANTIRLSLFARRREVQVMKLVGATDWFIRWPFVIEGVVLGALGGILAICLLAIAKVALIDPLSTSFRLIAAPGTINFGLLVVVLAGASIAVSAAGSGLSLRRFLRV
ncbi:MAG: cell division protein FtsX [Solirubrobacteraceae bacterium]|nr:MAG: ABC transporter permease [Solirubrobacterales bacterium]